MRSSVRQMSISVKLCGDEFLSALTFSPSTMSNSTSSPSSTERTILLGLLEIIAVYSEGKRDNYKCAIEGVNWAPQSRVLQKPPSLEDQVTWWIKMSSFSLSFLDIKPYPCLQLNHLIWPLTLDAAEEKSVKLKKKKKKCRFGDWCEYERTASRDLPNIFLAGAAGSSLFFVVGDSVSLILMEIHLLAIRCAPRW